MTASYRGSNQALRTKLPSVGSRRTVRPETSSNQARRAQRSRFFEALDSKKLLPTSCVTLLHSHTYLNKLARSSEPDWVTAGCSCGRAPNKHHYHSSPAILRPEFDVI